MRAAELFDAGYTDVCYDIAKAVQHFRFRDESWTFPYGAIPLTMIDDHPVFVAKVDQVRAYAAT